MIKSLLSISSQFEIVSKHSSNVLFFPAAILSAKYYLFDTKIPFTSNLPNPENAVQKDISIIKMKQKNKAANKYPWLSLDIANSGKAIPI